MILSRVPEIAETRLSCNDLDPRRCCWGWKRLHGEAARSIQSARCQGRIGYSDKFRLPAQSNASTRRGHGSSELESFRRDRSFGNLRATPGSDSVTDVTSNSIQNEEIRGTTTLGFEIGD